MRFLLSYPSAPSAATATTIVTLVLCQIIGQVCASDVNICNKPTEAQLAAVRTHALTILQTSLYEKPTQLTFPNSRTVTSIAKTFP